VRIGQVSRVLIQDLLKLQYRMSVVLRARKQCRPATMPMFSCVWVALLLAALPRWASGTCVDDCREVFEGCNDLCVSSGQTSSCFTACQDLNGACFDSCGGDGGGEDGDGSETSDDRSSSEYNAPTPSPTATGVIINEPTAGSEPEGCPNRAEDRKKLAKAVRACKKFCRQTHKSAHTCNQACQQPSKSASSGGTDCGNNESLFVRGSC
jgi:hypothetical protein